MKFLFIESRITDAQGKYKIPQIVMDKLAEIDPTSTKKYIDRIAYWYKSFKPLEDITTAIATIKEVINMFEANKNNPNLKIKDINDPVYDNIKNAKVILALATKIPDPIEFVNKGIKKFHSINFTEGEFIFIPLRTKEEAIYYGQIQRIIADRKKGPDVTKWCISRPDDKNMFTSYTTDVDENSELSTLTYVQSINDITKCYVIEMYIYFITSNCNFTYYDNTNMNFSEEEDESITKLFKTSKPFPVNAYFTYIIKEAIKNNDIRMLTYLINYDYGGESDYIEFLLKLFEKHKQQILGLLYKFKGKDDAIGVIDDIFRFFIEHDSYFSKKVIMDFYGKDAVL